MSDACPLHHFLPENRVGFREIPLRRFAQTVNTTVTSKRLANYLARHIVESEARVRSHTFSFALISLTASLPSTDGKQFNLRRRGLPALLASTELLYEITPPPNDKAASHAFGQLAFQLTKDASMITATKKIKGWKLDPKVLADL